MKKKILFALCLTVVLTALLAISVSAAEPIETWDISATENDNVTACLCADPENSGMYSLTISGTGNMMGMPALTGSPWYSAYRRQISSLTICDGITNIGASAFFGCEGLTEVVIGNDVVEIEGDAFNGCRGLTSIVIPNNVKSIGHFAFENCERLQSVTIGDTVTEIGVAAFRCCYNLKDIVIPNSIITIESNAFADCGNIRYNVYEYGKYLGNKENPYLVLMGITNASKSNFEINESTKIINHEVFYYYENLTAITIPDSVISIGEKAFYHCTGLRSVMNGENIIHIGEAAFWDCENLTYMSIPKGLKIINSNIFHGCRSLTSITIHENVTYIGSGAFSGCSNLVEINFNSTNANEKITTRPFIGTGNLSEGITLNVGKGVTQIPDGLFGSLRDDAPKIKNVVFEKDSVCTSIGESAFRNCTSLVSVIIPNSVVDINKYAFSGCVAMTRVTVPDSTINVSYYIFDGCTSLTIYCRAEAQPSGWDLEWNSSNCPVIWNYKNTVKNDVFTFKGYSFGMLGQISFGFDIDYEAKALYEELTGDTLEMGVVFAGYDNLGGAQPLDENSKETKLDVGRVIKVDLTSYSYQSYDFALFDITDSLSDVKLVIAAYIYDGECVKYVQENGIGDTVTGISYNEAKESVAK